MCAAALCAPSHRTAAACGIYSSARTARCGRARGLRSARPAGCRARFAAGVTWTCRTASAPWAARHSHTSVIDAAGAIYVIGGTDGTFSPDLQDVWASTDGGARAGLGPGGDRGVLKWGTQVGYSSRVRRGTAEYEGVVMGFPRGYSGVPRGYWVLDGVLGDRRELLTGVLRGAQGGTLGSTLVGFYRAFSAEYRAMPRALKAAPQRGTQRGTQWGTQDYTDGTQLILRGYSGDSWGCGVHVGVPRGLHRRARTPKRVR